MLLVPTDNRILLLVYFTNQGDADDFAVVLCPVIIMQIIAISIHSTLAANLQRRYINCVVRKWSLHFPPREYGTAFITRTATCTSLRGAIRYGK